MPGSFGYELDPAKLSAGDREAIKEHIGIFKKHYSLIQQGLYYRLTGAGECNYMAWEFASEDGSEALLNVVVTDTQPNQPLINLRLRGLRVDAEYELTEESEKYMYSMDLYGGEPAMPRRYRGDALMNAGYTFPMLFGDYPAVQLHFRAV